jgi:hypothetical protein
MNSATGFELDISHSRLQIPARQNYQKEIKNVSATFGHISSFKAGNGIQRTESGRLVGGVEQTVQGLWEYLDPDGKVGKIRQTL